VTVDGCQQRAAKSSLDPHQTSRKPATTKKQSALEESLARLHDGHLVGVRVDDGSVSLECRHLTGEEQTIVIGGVEEMCCSNFRQGNIILNVEILHSMDALRALSEQLVEALAHSTRSEHVEAHVARYRAKELSAAIRYFVLGSSYGADVVVAFSGSVTLLRVTRRSLEE
jgi:hypothetical protein